MQQVLAVFFGLRGHRGDPMASRVFGTYLMTSCRPSSASFVAVGSPVSGLQPAIS